LRDLQIFWSRRTQLDINGGSRSKIRPNPQLLCALSDDGSWIGAWPLGDGQNASLPVNCSELNTLLWEYTQELGIPIDFSAVVDDYFETDNEAGIILTGGQKLTADIVVAADRVGSKSWSLVLGEKDVAISSEFAYYRAAFPAGEALKNPIIAKQCENQPDRASMHIGPGAVWSWEKLNGKYAIY